MRFAFANRKLEALYLEGKGVRKLPEGVYFAFLDAIAVIIAIQDERELYDRPGLRPERLSGKRSGDYSLRLNKQFRLIYNIETDSEGNLILLLNIEDYH
jgi:toxin HigB-1